MKVPLIMRPAHSATTSASMVRSACSISERTSPIPRMREAIRSGWKRSKSSIFSPVEAKTTGPADDPARREHRAAARVVVELRDDEARERERVVEGARRVHGVLTGHGVDDQERVVRRGRLADRRAPRPSAPGRSRVDRRCR